MDKRGEHCIDTPQRQDPVTVTDAENVNDAVSLTEGPFIPRVIDSHSGLVDELLNCGILNESQVQRINSEKSRRLRSSHLLLEVGTLASDKLALFLSALDKTQQSHVTNYIRNNGQQTDTTDDNWPAIYEYDRMRQSWSRLLKLIDSRNGLCSELIAAQCISFYDNDCINQYQVMADRNEELMNIMAQKSRIYFKKFVECLIKTNQHHVAALLDPNIAQDVQPVSEQHISRLIQCYAQLVELIDLNILMMELLAANVITKNQKDFIQSASTATESKERLLDCVKRGSQRDFDKFIKCLEKTGQQHVADLLRSDGVVVEMDAHTNLSLAEEDAIVEEFFKYFQKTTTQKRQQLRLKFDQLSDALKDSHLIAMHTKHSIKLFFICESFSGLLHLYELYCTQKLEIIVQQLLTVLFNNEKPVELHRLKWNMSNYNNCVQNLSSSYGLPVYSYIHQLANLQLPDVITEPSVISLDKNGRLPHELIELLIIKAAGKLFVNLTKMTTRADVHTLTTLNSVCRYWWETLTYRRSNRKTLRQFLEHNCAPYRFNPKLITTLNFQNCKLAGVAELDHKLYIIAEMSNTVRVRSRVHFNFRDVGEDFKVPEMINPVDVAACSTTRCLYVSDNMSRCIWRVHLSSSLNVKSVEKLIKLKYEPWKLSIQSNRLLTVHGGRAWFFYNCGDGALLRKIEENNDDVIDGDEAQPQIGRLLRYVDILHAVETIDGRLIVCYTPRCHGDTEHRPEVSEVSVDGQVLRTYEGATGINRFSFLTVDGRNHILVSDDYKRQMLRLNSKLALQQVLLTELNGIPLRLCYSQQTGLLYICYYASPNIDVYKVTN